MSAAPRARACPRCGEGALLPFAAENGAAVERCERCAAIWCARGTLAEVLGVSAHHPFLIGNRRTATLTGSSCPDCRASMLGRVRLGRSGLTLDRCASCAGESIEGAALGTIGEAILAHIEDDASLPPIGTVPPRGAYPMLGANSHAPTALPAGLGNDRFEYDVPLVNALAVPIALSLALILDATWLRHLVSNFFVNMWLHELGHAAVAWMSGYYALLLPFVTFTFTDQKSLLTSMIVALLLGAALISGVSGKHRYLVVLGGGGLGLQAILTLIVPRRLTFEWLTFAGCAGEFTWSTLILVSFYYRLPDRLRWDFWRYLALLMGAFGLVHALGMWIGISQDLALMPMGTALGGADDGDGDLNRLVRLYHWTQEGIVATYLRLGYLCLAVVAGHYAVFLMRAIKARREAGPGGIAR